MYSNPSLFDGASLSGLVSVSATTFVGALTGTATNSTQLNGQNAAFYTSTTNINEGTNLFYTDTRVLTAALANLSTTDSSAITASDTILSSLGKLQAQISTSGISSVASVNGLTGTVVLTTSSISEGSNLYFTSARVLATTITSSPTNSAMATSDTIAIALNKAQGQINAKFTTPAGTTLQYVRGDGSLATLNSSIVPENTNLYYTDVRAKAATLAAVLTGFSATNSAITATDSVLVAFNKAQGQISAKFTTPAGTILQYVRGDSSLATLNTASVPESGNLYYTDTRVRAVLLVGLSSASGGTLAASDTMLAAFGKIENRLALNDAKVTYPGPPTFAAITSKPTTVSGYGITDVVSQLLTGLSTATNATIAASDTILAGMGKLQAQITNISVGGGAVSSVNSLTGAVVLTTSNISEGSNLYFTSARVLSTTITSSPTNSAMATSDTIAAALNKAQGQINAKFTTPAGTTLQYLRGDGSLATLNTSSVPESGNLYYTDVRVCAAVLTGLSAASGGTLATTDTVLSAFGKLEYRTALNDAKVTYPGPPTFAAVTSKPTTISGYGITDILAQTLTSLSVATNAVITSSDTLISGMGKLQAQITNISVGGGGTTGYQGSTQTVWSPDMPPASPSAYDDEFNSSVLSGLWTLVNAGNLVTYNANTQVPGCLWFESVVNTSSSYPCILQPIPTGDFTVIGKITMNQSGNGTLGGITTGLILSNSNTAGTGSQYYLAQGTSVSQGPYMQLIAGTNFSVSSSVGVFYQDRAQYIRIRRVGTDYYWGWATDGKTFTEVSYNPGTTPSYFGWCFANASATRADASLEFFRYIPNGNSTNLPGGLMTYGVGYTGSGGGSVLSVNGLTGTVVITPSNINYTNTTTSVAQTVQTVLDSQQVFNASQWNVVSGTGADQSSNITSAINAVYALGGGIIQLPYGHIKANIVINKPGVIIRHYGKQNIPSSTCYIEPYNITLPTVQIADDSANMFGSGLEDICLYTPDGTGYKGLVFYGGAFKCHALNISIIGFTQSCLEFTNNDVHPCSYNKVHNLEIVSGVVGCIGINHVDKHTTGTGWTTACSVDQFSVVVQSGYQVAMQSSSGLQISNGYLQGAYSGYGLLFNNAYGSAAGGLEVTNVDMDYVSYPPTGFPSYVTVTYDCGVDYRTSTWSSVGAFVGQISSAGMMMVIAGHTTGSITSGQYTLTVANITGIRPGRQVHVLGAGQSMGTGNIPLIATIVSISGLVLTLDTAASATVSNADTGYGDIAPLETLAGKNSYLPTTGIAFNAGNCQDLGSGFMNTMFRASGTGSHAPFDAGNLVIRSPYNGSINFLQINSSPTIPSITQSGTTVTVTCSGGHHLSINDLFVIDGCNEAGINTKLGQVVTVTSSTVFTYTSSVSQTLAGVTGSPTLTSYKNNRFYNGQLQLNTSGLGMYNQNGTVGNVMYTSSTNAILQLQTPDTTNGSFTATWGSGITTGTGFAFGNSSGNKAYITGNGVLKLAKASAPSTDSSNGTIYISTLGDLHYLSTAGVDTNISQSAGVISSVARNAQTGSYSLTNSDTYVVYTGSGGDTFTLPTTGLFVGRVIILKNRGAGNLTLSGTIDGSSTTTLSTLRGVMLIYSGSEWESI